MSQYIDLARQGDQGAKVAENYFGFIMSQMPGGDKIIDSAIALGGEAREEALQPGELEKQAADIGLTKAQTTKAMVETAGTTRKTQEAVMELERLKSQGGLSDKEKSDKENTLRKEFNALVGDYDTVLTNFDNMVASATRNSGAGDVALITNFMKMLDPNSVVREGEFATAEKSTGLYNQLINVVDKATKGNKLTPSGRTEFLKLAKEYKANYENMANKYINQYTKIGNDYGIKAENIIRFTPSGTTVKETVVKPTETTTTQQGFSRARPTQQQPQIIRGL